VAVVAESGDKGDTDPAGMTVEACRAELSRELDVNRLRALVAIQRQLREMQRRVLTGTVQVNVKEGRVRRVERPDYMNIG
jgi:hypothetical protein